MVQMLEVSRSPVVGQQLPRSLVRDWLLVSTGPEAHEFTSEATPTTGHHP